jgi:hypothetical protein
MKALEFLAGVALGAVLVLTVGLVGAFSFGSMGRYVKARNL